jgi:hypothetical protein
MTDLSNEYHEYKFIRKGPAIPSKREMKVLIEHCKNNTFHPQINEVSEYIDNLVSND